MIDAVGRLAQGIQRALSGGMGADDDSEWSQGRSSYAPCQASTALRISSWRSGRRRSWRRRRRDRARRARQAHGRPSAEGSPYRTAAAAGSSTPARLTVRARRCQRGVSAHGHGARHHRDAFTFVHENVRRLGGARGIAVFSTDQPLHGARGGSRGARRAAASRCRLADGAPPPRRAPRRRRITFYNGLNARALSATSARRPLTGWCSRGSSRDRFQEPPGRAEPPHARASPAARARAATRAAS